MNFQAINPATEEILGEYSYLEKEELWTIAAEVRKVSKLWQKKTLEERANFCTKLGEVLRSTKDSLARTITTEMGKPIKESRAEIEKCAGTAEFYGNMAFEWLKDEVVSADGIKHLVKFEPLGVILSIMPWNFPFWQAIRFGIPALLGGNGVILKHSDLVPESALAIENCFLKAGFPENLFKNAFLNYEVTGELIKSDYVQGVSLTGSTIAGAKVAAIAGGAIKKVVLELGGSDPFIVLEDAEVEKAARNAVAGRMLNSGQSCIASKRFFISKKISEKFLKIFIKVTKELKTGDPLKDATDIGPMASEKQLRQILEQLDEALKKGAKLETGGERLQGKGYFLKPAILTGVTEKMRVLNEEVFGPVSPIIEFDSLEDVICQVNSSEFGLGASLWTKDLEKAERIAKEIEAGVVFVNSIVKSDPRMPFGGTKKSGIGRELSRYGLMEFLNIKGVNIYN